VVSCRSPVSQSLKTLVALCRGMKDNDSNDLMDVKSFPWNKLKPLTVKPNNQEYNKEIMQHYNAMKSLQEELSPSLRGASTQGLEYRETSKLVGQSPCQWIGRCGIPHQNSDESESTG
jgi:hypothetical protein